MCGGAGKERAGSRQFAFCHWPPEEEEENNSTYLQYQGAAGVKGSNSNRTALSRTPRSTLKQGYVDWVHTCMLGTHIPSPHFYTSQRFAHSPTVPCPALNATQGLCRCSGTGHRIHIAVPQGSYAAAWGTCRAPGACLPATLAAPAVAAAAAAHEDKCCHTVALMQAAVCPELISPKSWVMT